MTTKYNEFTGTKLIDWMKDGKSFASFAAEMEIAQSTLFGWLDKYPEFESARGVGTSMCLNWWEGVLREASTTDQRRSASMIIFALKNLLPDNFKDEKNVNIGGQIQLINIETGIQRIEAIDAESKAIDVDDEDIL